MDFFLDHLTVSNVHTWNFDLDIPAKEDNRSVRGAGMRSKKYLSKAMLVVSISARYEAYGYQAQRKGSGKIVRRWAGCNLLPIVLLLRHKHDRCDTVRSK